MIEYDESLDRLVSLTAQTNLVALDKSLAAIGRAPGQYAVSAARVGSIAERIVSAAHDVGSCLPLDMRATSINDLFFVSDHDSGLIQAENIITINFGKK